MYMHAYVYMHAYMHVCMSKCGNVCSHAFACEYRHVNLFVSENAHVHVSVHPCAHVYVHVCTCMCAIVPAQSHFSRGYLGEVHVSRRHVHTTTMQGAPYQLGMSCSVTEGHAWCMAF